MIDLCQIRINFNFTYHPGPQLQPEGELVRCLRVLLDDGPRVGQAVVPHRTRVQREERLAQAIAGMVALCPRSVARLEGKNDNALR